MFPYHILSFTNSTELIDVTNELGHGVSSSILEKGSNAFKVLEQQRKELLIMLTGVNETKQES